MNYLALLVPLILAGIGIAKALTHHRKRQAAIRAQRKAERAEQEARLQEIVFAMRDTSENPAFRRSLRWLLRHAIERTIRQMRFGCDIDRVTETARDTLLLVGFVEVEITTDPAGE